jgi:hypothetical protein
MEGIYFAERDSPEWDSMWAWLGRHPINQGIDEPTVAPDPEWGECWQYMGTEETWSDGRWFHCFRHRHHPVRQERVYLRCPASPPPSQEKEKT